MAMTFTNEELNGAIALLVKCLELQSGDTFALFFDDASDGVAELITCAASKLGLKAILRRIPIEVQVGFSQGDELSLEDSSALSEGRAIITCLDAHSAGLEYRRALLRFGTSADKRLAHMPGARAEFFRNTIDLDYSPIVSKCDDLALALATGEKAVVLTYINDERGNAVQEHRLCFALGGMGRLPVVSTGLISPGTWGNVPGAETFIAPIEGTAEGTYVLNGSFKGCVISGDSRIFLTFSGGNLTSVDGTPDVLPSFMKLLGHLQQIARTSVFGLAEFGIGANPAVLQLVGTSLIDEKCIGTVHIAIGSNAGYGGQLNAPVHEDFVTRSPTVEIDGKKILERGTDRFVHREWRERLTDVALSPTSLLPKAQIRRTFAAAEVNHETLKVRRFFGADRLCRYTVGDATTSKLLAHLYRRIPNLPGAIEVGDLIHNTGMDRELVAAILTILHRHQLIELRG